MILLKKSRTYHINEIHHKYKHHKISIVSRFVFIALESHLIRQQLEWNNAANTAC